MNYYSEPLYIHDCDGCKFMGHVMNHDLYYCPAPGEIVMRRSSDGPDYRSGLNFAQEKFFNSVMNDCSKDETIILMLLYREALLRAITRGYVTNPSIDDINHKGTRTSWVVENGKVNKKS